MSDRDIEVLRNADGSPTAYIPHRGRVYHALAYASKIDDAGIALDPRSACGKTFPKAYYTWSGQRITCPRCRRLLGE